MHILYVIAVDTSVANQRIACWAAQCNMPSVGQWSGEYTINSLEANKLLAQTQHKHSRQWKIPHQHQQYKQNLYISLCCICLKILYMVVKELFPHHNFLLMLKFKPIQSNNKTFGKCSLHNSLNNFYIHDKY